MDLHARREQRERREMQRERHRLEEQARLLRERHRALLSMSGSQAPAGFADLRRGVEELRQLRRQQERLERGLVAEGTPGDHQRGLSVFRSLIQQASADNADGPRERALRALADAAAAFDPFAGGTVSSPYSFLSPREFFDEASTVLLDGAADAVQAIREQALLTLGKLVRDTDVAGRVWEDEDRGAPAAAEARTACHSPPPPRSSELAGRPSPSMPTVLARPPVSQRARRCWRRRWGTTRGRPSLRTTPSRSSRRQGTSGATRPRAPRCSARYASAAAAARRGPRAC